MENIIENVSFVVIARNEEFAISKCLKSLECLECINCQFIFIDSASSDNTLKLMKSFKSDNEIKIIKISGKLNASIARNVGFKKNTKIFTFFVDGDSSINQAFILTAIERLKNDPTCLAVSGSIDEVVYNQHSKTTSIPNKTVSKYKYETNIRLFGGIILVKSSALNEHGTWNEYFNIHEDFELSLMLNKHGKILFIPKQMAVHHTFEYRKRTWEYFANGNVKFSGVLIRKYLLDFKVLFFLFKKPFLGQIIGVAFYLLFIMSILLILFTSNINALVGLFLCVLLDILCALPKKQSIVNRMIIRFIYPFGLIYGLFIVSEKRSKSEKFDSEEIL